MTSVSPAVTFWAWNAAMMAVAGLAEPAPQRKTEGCWHGDVDLGKSVHQYGEIWRRRGG